jgi:receptor protein-tyrosine kinase
VELLAYVKVLRRRKALIVVPLLVTVLAALALSLLGPRSYSSSTTLFFSQNGSTAASSQDDQRLATYASLVQSPRVTSAVIDRLHLDESLDDVRDSLSAVTKPGTLLVEVTATTSSPTQARQMATVATSELVRLSAALEPQPVTAPSSGLRVAQKATPARAHSPLGRNLSLGAALGLFVGVILALVREGLDDRVSSDDQLLGDHGLRTLVQLPVSPDEDNAAVLLDDRRRPLDAAFRRLRLALQLTGAPAPRTIIVAACSGGAGAMATSSGLALTLADAGLRTVLVCADPSHGSDFPDQPPAGLAELLNGDVTLDDVLQPTSHDLLQRLAPGQDTEFLDERLASDAMSKLLARLQSEVDVVLVEAPPLPDSVAAALLAESTGAGVLLVVRRGETRRNTVGQAVRLVRQSGAPLLGAVVTHGPTERGPLTAAMHAWNLLPIGRAVQLYAASTQLPAPRVAPQDP